MITPPKLDPGFYSVLSNEYSTGKVLTIEGIRYTGEGQLFWEFFSLPSAQEFISKMIESNPEVEYNLYDSNGHFQYVQNINGKRT